MNSLKPKRGVEVDIGPKIIEKVRSLFPEHEYHCMDIENLITIMEKFDFAILSDTIWHLLNIEETFRKIRFVCH